MVLRIGTGREENGSEAKHHAGAERQHQRKEKHGSVQADGMKLAQLRGQQRGERRYAPPGEQHAGDASEDAEKQAFGEQLAGDTAGVRAESDANGDFFLPCGGAGEQKVRHVGAGMMLIASELEKLVLYVGPKKHVTLGDVETMVLAAKQRSLYELTDAISAKDRARALSLLHGLLNASDGGEDSAIGHLYMLARTFRQMLVILEKNVRDSRAIWQALWQGFRMPPFAAEDVIRQARRYKSRRELTRALRLIARADMELRSQPPDKRLVLERLVLELASDPKPSHLSGLSPQYAMEW